MEILKLLTDAVLRTLVGYLEFCLDLLALHGLDSYVRSDQVSTSLLSYFIVGGTIAYFLTKGKVVPGLLRVEVDTDRRDAADRLIFGIIVVKVFVYAAASHVVLLAVGKIWNIPIGSARVTLNAWLASSAVVIPLTVVSRRLRSTGLYFLRGVYRESDDLFRGLTLGILSRTAGIASFFYSGLVLACMHGIGLMFGLIPGFLLIAGVLVWRLMAWFHHLVRRSQSTKAIREMWESEPLSHVFYEQIRPSPGLNPTSPLVRFRAVRPSSAGRQDQRHEHAHRP